MIIHVVEGEFILNVDAKLCVVTTDYHYYIGDTVIINGVICVECDGEYYVPKLSFKRL